MSATATAVRAADAHSDPRVDALSLHASEASLPSGIRAQAALRGLLLAVLALALSAAAALLLTSTIFGSAGIA